MIPPPAASTDPFDVAKELGRLIVEYGVDSSKLAGFVPPAGGDPAHAVLKDAFPRIEAELKRQGLL